MEQGPQRTQICKCGRNTRSSGARGPEAGVGLRLEGPRGETSRSGYRWTGLNHGGDSVRGFPLNPAHLGSSAQVSPEVFNHYGACSPHTFTFTPSAGWEQCGFVSLSSKGGLNLPVQLNFPGVCVRLRVCQGLGAEALLGPEQPVPHPAGHTETQCWDAGGLGERMPCRKEVRGLFRQQLLHEGVVGRDP